MLRRLDRSLAAWCIALFAVANLLLLAAACQSAEKPELTISRQQPEGFPVPEGFQFLEGRSYCYRSGQFESATYVWKGRDDIEQVAEFYRRRMPDHGWRISEEADATDASRLGRTISFTRDEKRVEVTVKAEEVRGQTSKNLNVTMRVMPVHRADPTST